MYFAQRSTMAISPDAVCVAFFEKAQGRSKLTIRQLETDEQGTMTMLIEGNQEALEFLGNLLLAQAQCAADCGFQLTSSTFFNSENQVIYIHRLPCQDGRP